MGLDGEKGFFTIDAMFALLILVALSSTLFASATRTRGMAEETSLQFEQKMALEKISGGINTVYANGYGKRKFELNLDVKENILEENQVISIDTEERTLQIKNSEDNTPPHVKASFIPSNVENFQLKSDNLNNHIRIFWAEENIKVREKELGG